MMKALTLLLALGVGVCALQTSVWADDDAKTIEAKLEDIKQRMENGDLSAMAEYREVYGEMMRQMSSAGPEEINRLIEANQNVWGKPESDEEVEARRERVRQTEENDARLRQAYEQFTQQSGNTASPIEQQQRQDDFTDTVIKLNTPTDAYDEFKAATATGGRIDDPSFMAWKKNYVDQLASAAEVERARVTLRAKYQRYSELVNDGREEALPSLGGSSAAGRPRREDTAQRGQRLFKDIFAALAGRQVEQILANVNRLRSGDASGRMELAGFTQFMAAYGVGADKDRAPTDGRLRAAIDELDGLADAGSLEIRVRALNAMGVAHCLLNEDEDSQAFFDKAATVASNLSLAQENQFTLMFNADVYGCDGSASRHGNSTAQFEGMRQTVSGAFGRIIAFHEDVRSKLIANDPLVLQSGIIAAGIEAGTNRNIAGARQRLENLQSAANLPIDPLLESSLLLFLGYISFELNDTVQAADYAQQAEELAAPAIQQYVLAGGEKPVQSAPSLDPSTVAMLNMLRSSGGPESMAMAESLESMLSALGDPSATDDEQRNAAVQAIEQLSRHSGVEMPELPIDPRSPGAEMANEPDDPAVAINYYLELLWLAFNSRPLDTSFLTGENSLQDLNAFYDRVFSAWLLGYPPTMSQAVTEVSGLMDELVHENLYDLSFAEQLAFVTGYLPTQTSVILSGERAFDIDESNLEQVVRWKGLLTLATQKQSKVVAAAMADEAFNADAVRLLEIRRTMSAVLVAGQPGETAFRDLTREKEMLERRLSGRFSTSIRNVVDVTMQNLRDVMQDAEIFVDIYRYDHYRDASFEATEYTALIVERNSPVIVASLGDAARIDRAISEWRLAAIANSPETDEKWLYLRGLIWSPISDAARLTGRRILLAPDSETSRVPWQLFVSDGELTQVDSARVLIASRTARRPGANGGVLLVGDVDFGLGPLGLAPLAGSGVEVRTIGNLAGNAGLEATVLTSNDATEENVVDLMQKSGWVHLATHGLFAPSTQVRASSRGLGVQQSRAMVSAASTSRNPMMNSGLAFAGANGLSSTSVDGYLSAEELLGLDLGSAELIVLSACNTGRGLETTGQGVIGLRSALSAAGARAVLMSLWEVDDVATMELMRRFYEGIWNDGLSRAVSLSRAQASLKADPRFAEPYYWAAWVLVDGSR